MATHNTREGREGMEKQRTVEEKVKEKTIICHDCYRIVRSLEEHICQGMENEDNLWK
jgi:hypothetical protein